MLVKDQGDAGGMRAVGPQDGSGGVQFPSSAFDQDGAVGRSHRDTADIPVEEIVLAVRPHLLRSTHLWGQGLRRNWWVAVVLRDQATVETLGHGRGEWGGSCAALEAPHLLRLGFERGRVFRIVRMRVSERFRRLPDVLESVSKRRRTIAVSSSS